MSHKRYSGTGEDDSDRLPWDSHVKYLSPWKNDSQNFLKFIKVFQAISTGHIVL